jgi:hypothetical protein
MDGIQSHGKNSVDPRGAQEIKRVMKPSCSVCVYCFGDGLREPINALYGGYCPCLSPWVVDIVHAYPRPALLRYPTGIPTRESILPAARKCGLPLQLRIGWPEEGVLITSREAAGVLCRHGFSAMSVVKQDGVTLMVDIVHAYCEPQDGVHSGALQGAPSSSHSRYRAIPLRRRTAPGRLAADGV